MHYRLFRRDDFVRLYAIEVACFQPPFRFSRQTMRKLVADADSATWIAEENDQMAGFAIIYLAKPPEQPLAYIQTLEVAPDQRSRGIGSELLRRVEESAKAAGAHVVWLHAAEANIKAVRLYESHGYRVQGREENFYGKAIPALLYAKSIK